MNRLFPSVLLLLALSAAAEPQAPSPAAPSLFGLLSSSESRLRASLPGSTGAAEVLRVMGQLRAEGLRLSPEKRDSVAQNGLPRLDAAAAALDASNATTPEAERIDDAVAALDNSAGEFEQALHFADRAIARDPSDEPAWVNRSDASFGLQRYISALADAERALALDDKDVHAYRARAMAEYGLKRYPEAVQDARRALAIDPADRTAFFIMKLAQDKGPAVDLAALKPREPSKPGAQPMAEPERAETASPSPTLSASVLVRDAARKLAVQDYAGAVEAADKALADDPENTAAYYYRAAAHNLAGDYVAAADDASHAIAINPHDAAARDTRAWAFNHMGRYRDAIADSNHSLEINPQNPYAFANLGYAYEQMGDVGTMLRDLKTAAGLNPEFAPAYKDAAQRYGAEPEPVQAPAAKQAAEAARRRSFFAILASSLVGGLLIALGILQFVGEAKQEPAAPALSPAAPAAPSGLDAYILGRKLGMGGMGIVHEAYDRMLERHVAVKRLRDELQGDAAVRRRLLQEARTVASLHHPGIIDIHSIIEDRSSLYLVFELLEGKTVADLLQDRGRLPLSECKRILKPVCEALDFAHRHLVVHRDLKPANIMLTDDGQVKLLDFGISRQAQPRLASLDPGDRRTGTPQYMAPEQERGLVRKESDVFSLGTCLYEMLTGRYPFPEPNGFAKSTLDYVRPSQMDAALPAELDAFLDEALQPDPERRISSAPEFWRKLERIPDSAQSVRARA